MNKMEEIIKIIMKLLLYIFITNICIIYPIGIAQYFKHMGSKIVFIIINFGR